MTDEQKQWIIDNFDSYHDYKKLHYAFEEKFSLGIKVDHIRITCNKNGKYLVAKRKTKNHIYTNEEIEWLKENYIPFIRADVLYNNFKKRFNINVSRNALINKCREDLGFKFANPSYYKIGVKRIDMHKEIGTIRKEKDGRRYIKVCCDYMGKQGKNSHNKNWKLYHKFLYEQYHNCKLLDSEYVIFLNGDKNDYSKENLYKLSRPEYAFLSLNKCLGNKEATLTMLEIFKCNQLVKQFK